MRSFEIRRGDGFEPIEFEQLRAGDVFRISAPADEVDGLELTAAGDPDESGILINRVVDRSRGPGGLPSVESHTAAQLEAIAAREERVHLYGVDQVVGDRRPAGDEASIHLTRNFVAHLLQLLESGDGVLEARDILRTLVR